MEQINQRHNRCSHKRRADKAVGNAAVMLQPSDGAFQVPDNINVGGFCRQRHGDGGERGLAIEAGAAQARPCQKMGNWIQSGSFAASNSNSSYLMSSIQLIGDIRSSDRKASLSVPIRYARFCRREGP